MTKKTVLLSISGFALASTMIFANPPKDCGQMGEHHKPMEFMDTNKDNKISQEEWLAHFKEMDTNNDGSVSMDEMDKHHQAMKEKHHEDLHKQMHESMKEDSKK